MRNKFTRRRFLTAVSAGAAWMALTNAPGCKPAEPATKATPSTTTSPAQPEPVLVEGSPLAPQQDAWTFRTRPDLSPRAVDVAKQSHDTAPRYVFVAPKKSGPGQGGPIIVDDRGQVVWFRPVHREGPRAMDFKVQNYRGEPVLTWGEGDYVILDSSYHEIARFHAGHGYRGNPANPGDHHEFLITPEDTALITIYNPVRGDLSPVGGSKDGLVWEGIVQELDIETGEVLFEWHSLDHVDLDETHVDPSKDTRSGIDYFHINSIDVDHDGNLLVSARRTFTVYKIDRESGEVIWRLGGKKSDFEMGPGTRFAYQHDARRQPNGTITIFDNGNTILENGIPKAVEESRGIVLELNEEEMSATLVREYTHPDKLFADASGNMQVLPNDNVFIGWGRALVFSEFSKDGELLFSASFPTNGSYRAFRFPWSGHPSDRPVAVAERASEEEVRVYASWNGATQVTTWEVLAGSSPNQLESLGSVRWDGFETAMLVRTNAEPYVVVRAKDRSGRVLGTTEPVQANRSTS
jgi:outer membrane protein assembly factor BamB